ncbi:MAG: protein kinase domain-containing protein [Planctomycetota bacterium]|jgi:serine/threonine protein kinase/formylglycine-generating enzyme required for sulfatase activity
MTERDPFAGKTIDGWTLVREIGRGGMGVVLLAKDAEGRRAAVKLLPPDVAKDQQYIARFEREAKVLASVEHPNLLKVFGTGRTPKGAYYIIMEYVDGKSLGEIIKMLGRVRPDQALGIVCKVAEGLQAAWDRNVIHRDIKPDNILLHRTGEVKISDLGLAKDTSENVKLTVTGQVIGTPAFMSPEQGMGKKVDFRTDIYSLGITLFSMLAGKRPFVGKSPLGVVMMHIHEAPPALRSLAPNLPNGVYDLVDRMLSKKPDDRPQSASEIIEIIHSIADESGWDVSMPPTVAEEGMDMTLDDLHGLKGMVDHAIHEDETQPTVPAQNARALEVTVTERLEDDELPGSTSDPLVGKMIAGKYLVRSRLGEGGMGSVYLVRHKDLDQDFALKVLRPELVANEAFRERFLREAKAATAFVHKHAIQIRDFGLDDNLLYMTMDFSRGQTLHEHLQEMETLSEREVASIAHQTLLALKEAHMAGLIHRDLKPANIMIEERGGESFVRILDFGVAKMVSDTGDQDQGGLSLTRTGTVVGTLQYMSPEQAAGGKIDPRSDLYAVATIMYEALTGTLPIEAENIQQMIYKLTVEPPVPLSTHLKGLSRPLERLIMKNLDKDPVKRSPSAASFLADLAACSDVLQSDVLTPRHRTGWILPALVGGGIVLCAVIVVLILLNPFSKEPGPQPHPLDGPPKSGKSWPRPPSSKTPGTKMSRLEAYRTWLQTGREALEGGDLEKALEAFRSAQEILPGEEVQTLIKTVRYRKAMGLCRAAMKDKDYTEARNQAYAAQQNAPSTEEGLKATELFEQAKTAVKRGETLYRKASAFQKSGEVLKAMAGFMAYIEEFPKGVNAKAAEDSVKALKKVLENFQGLVVRSNPAGAKVMLDGEEIGTTPMMFKEITPGPHTVLLALSGFRLVREAVQYDGKKVEITADMSTGAFGTLHVVGEETLTVSFQGTVLGVLPRNITNVPPGKGTVRITGPGDVAYDIPFECEAGRANTITVDFASLIEKEETAFKALSKGESLEDCRKRFSAFLEQFPAGKHHKTVESDLRKITEEGEIYATARDGDREAAEKYLAKFEEATYPLGWHVEEVKGMLAEARKAEEEKAYRAIGETSTLPGRKQACEAYLEGFRYGGHRSAVQKLYDALKEEERLIQQYDVETRFGEKLRIGKQYLRRFDKGFEAERIRRDLNDRIEEEGTGFEGLSALRDPERILRQASAYLEKFSGGERDEEVRKAMQAAREQIRALGACDTEGGCRSYLRRYPKGYYQKAVEARLARFGWRAEEVRGIRQPAVLPEDVRKGEDRGEYVNEKDESIMVFVPGGIFPLGTNDHYADGEERPRVYVYVGSFFMDKYEVTNRSYARFLKWSQTADDPFQFSHPLEKEMHPGAKDRTPAFWDDPRFRRPDRPVVGVDWFDAWAYARWAGKMLPSEAQWEIAASCDPKSRIKRKYPWGNDEPTSSHAVWDADAPMAVGGREFGASLHGVRDMAGNAAEWCRDAFDDDLWKKIADELSRQVRMWIPYEPVRFEKSPVVQEYFLAPFDPKEAKWSVRGGAFDDGEFRIRSVARRGASGRHKQIGFRCVKRPFK